MLNPNASIIATELGKESRLSLSFCWASLKALEDVESEPGSCDSALVAFFFFSNSAKFLASCFASVGVRSSGSVGRILNCFIIYTFFTREMVVSMFW
jgi:hypothetical protein